MASEADRSGGKVSVALLDDVETRLLRHPWCRWTLGLAAEWSAIDGFARSLAGDPTARLNFGELACRPTTIKGREFGNSIILLTNRGTVQRAEIKNYVRSLLDIMMAAG